MKNTEQTHPEVELEIGGEVVSVVANYRTIFNFEKATGKPFATILNDKYAMFSVEVTAEFIHAAIKNQNKKFTKDWILDNLNPEIMKKLGNDVYPRVVRACFLGEDEAEQEKKDEKTEEATPKKNESEIG